MVRRKKNILLCTTQKIKSRISHLINFARLTKRTMGWAVHHPLRPGKLHHQRPCRIVIDIIIIIIIIISSIVWMQGKPTSPHFVIKEVKNFDPKR